MEYLANAQRLNRENYSEVRKETVQELRTSTLFVWNTMILIVRRSMERVVWIDFDITVIYEADGLAMEREMAFPQT